MSSNDSRPLSVPPFERNPTVGEKKALGELASCFYDLMPPSWFVRVVREPNPEESWGFAGDGDALLLLLERTSTGRPHEFDQLVKDITASGMQYRSLQGKVFARRQYPAIRQAAAQVGM